MNNNNSIRYTEIGYLSTNFNLKKLIDVLNLLKDGVHNLPPRSNFGIKFIAGATNIKYLDINFTKCSFISYEDYKKIHKYYEIKTNDILLTIVGTIGNVAIVKKTDLPFSLQRSIAILRPNKKILDHKFLFYWLTSPKFKQLLYSRINSTAQPGIYLRMLGELKIPIPNMIIQNRIANIFSNLDNKIKNIQNQNRILEQMVQAIFKSQFVDFDGITEFENSELGKIPKGWKIEKIENVIKIFDKQRIPLSTMERMNRKGKYPYYGATSIIDHIDDYIFDGIFLLIGEDGSVIDENNLPFVQYVNGKMWVNNHAHVIQGKNEITTEFLTLFFKRLNIDPWITGTTQLKINQTNLLSIPIIIPDKISLKRFDRIAYPIFTRIIENDMMNLSLTKIRDILLPKLLSGELKV